MNSIKKVVMKIQMVKQDIIYQYTHRYFTIEK